MLVTYRLNLLLILTPGQTCFELVCFWLCASVNNWQLHNELPTASTCLELTTSTSADCLFGCPCCSLRPHRAVTYKRKLVLDFSSQLLRLLQRLHHNEVFASGRLATPRWIILALWTEAWRCTPHSVSSFSASQNWATLPTLGRLWLAFYAKRARTNAVRRINPKHSH